MAEIEEPQEEVVETEESTTEEPVSEDKPDKVFFSKEFLEQQEKEKEEKSEEEPKEEEKEVVEGPENAEEKEEVVEKEVVAEEPAEEEVEVEEKEEEVEEDPFPEDIKKLYNEDEFVKNFLDVYKNGGDIKNYLEVSSIDFNSLSEVDLFRRQVDQEYPNEDASTRREILEDELLKRFGYDLESGEFTETEKPKASQAIMKREAEKIRKDGLAKQKEFTIPEKREVPNEDIDTLVEKRITSLNEETTRERAKEAQNWEKTVNQNTEIKKFLESGKIETVLPDGSTFNYEVEDSKSFLEATLDNAKFWESLVDKDGGLDFNKWLKVLNYAKNIDHFESELVKEGQRIGEAKYLKEKKGIDVPTEKRTDNPDSQSGLKDAFKEAARKAKNW